MADINIKEGGGGGGGGRYAYEMLKNAKNQKCTTSPGIGNLQSVNSEQAQWAIDASDVALRSSGEWIFFTNKKNTHTEYTHIHTNKQTNKWNKIKKHYKNDKNREKRKLHTFHK